MAKNQTRRNFLQVASLAAAVSIPFTENSLFASSAGATSGEPGAPEPFQLFTAEKLAADLKAFEAQPMEHFLYQPQTVPLTIALTTQGKVSAGEFEWHEGRDHVFLILEGGTKFEVGGTPQNPRKTRPGEWLASASEGATTLNLKKGDMLLVPRGTPHKQTTEVSVAWMLISSSGAAKA